MLLVTKEIQYKGGLVYEGNIYMTLPLVILVIFFIFLGFITKDINIDLGSVFCR